MKQKFALIITLLLTTLFLKNVVLNTLLWREVVPSDRDTYLQF